MFTNQLDTCNVQSSVDVHESSWYLQRSVLCWCARIILVTRDVQSSVDVHKCVTFTHDFHSWRLLAYELINTRLCMIRFHKHSWCSSLINALYRTLAFNAKPHGWCYAAHITLARFRCKLQQDVNLLGIHKDDHIIHSRASASLNISWLSVSMKYQKYYHWYHGT